MGAFLYEDVISLHLKSKESTSPVRQRVKIVRGESDEYKVDFLIVGGSLETGVGQSKWDFTIPNKTVLFDEGHGGQLCFETPFRLNAFAEILRAFPAARGRFVVDAASIGDFVETKRHLKGEIEKLGAPLDRFRFVFRKNKLVGHPETKLWLIPNSKK